ncbi:MAG: hypothetical protein LBT22_06765 [Peptococcaceae bacterium]|nr:hypothetical protein [Peptococcaceae bacterium]
MKFFLVLQVILIVTIPAVVFLVFSQFNPQIDVWGKYPLWLYPLLKLVAYTLFGFALSLRQLSVKRKRRIRIALLLAEVILCAISVWYVAFFYVPFEVPFLWLASYDRIPLQAFVGIAFGYFLIATISRPDKV